MKKEFDLSMNSTTGLRKMILANPSLPLLVFAGDEAYDGDNPYNQVSVNRVAIQELTLYMGQWMEREDFRENLMYDTNYEKRHAGTYAKMTDSEFEAMIDDKVKNTEFVKTIVIYVG